MSEPTKEQEIAHIDRDAEPRSGVAYIASCLGVSVDAVDSFGSPGNELYTVEIQSGFVSIAHPNGVRWKAMAHSSSPVGFGEDVQEAVIDLIPKMAEWIRELQGRLRHLEQIAGMRLAESRAVETPEPPHPDGCFSDSAVRSRDCEGDGHFVCMSCTRFTGRGET